jgi:hypothetical protein
MPDNTLKPSDGPSVTLVFGDGGKVVDAYQRDATPAAMARP